MSTRSPAPYASPYAAGAGLGVVLFASYVLAGRGLGALNRLAIAAAGGLVMGGGAVFARGCTSGQALTGGALLSVGSWLFVAGAFGAGFLTMLAVRRIWT